MTADWTPHCLVCGRPTSDPCQRCAELGPYFDYPPARLAPCTPAPTPDPTERTTP